MKATVYLGGEWVLEGTAEEIADAMAKYDFSKYLQKKTSILTRQNIVEKRGEPDCAKCRHFLAMFPAEANYCKNHNMCCQHARKSESFCGRSGRHFDPNKAEAV